MNMKLMIREYAMILKILHFLNMKKSKECLFISRQKNRTENSQYWSIINKQHFYDLVKLYYYI